MTVNLKPPLQGDAKRVREIIDQQKGHDIYKDRYERNIVTPPSVHLDKETLWETMLMCLLTSQQKSGANDPVAMFLKLKPFPLHYDEVQKRKDVHQFVREKLQGQGIRNWDKKIPNEAAGNYFILEGRSNEVQGTWKDLIARGEELHSQRKQKYPPYDLKHYSLERKSAEWVDKLYKGFGPKQSRNFWQALGLTRYVSVIDSRIKKWCTANFGSSWSYYDPNEPDDYLKMEHSIRQLCQEADVLPCEFDAAVFSTFEKEILAASICRGD